MANNFEKRKAKEEAEAAAKEVAAKVVESVFDRIAYDVFFDEEKRKFVRVTLEYDLTTGIGRVKNLKEIADSQPVAIMKMGTAFNRKVFNLPPED